MRRHTWIAAACAAPMVAAAAVAWINTADLTPIRANIIFRLGRELASQPAAAMTFYQRASLLSPSEDGYYAALGMAYYAAANSRIGLSIKPRLDDDTPLARILAHDDFDAAQQFSRTDALSAAQKVLLRARDLSPLDAAYYAILARFYQPDLPVDTPERVQLANLAESNYAQALRLHPLNIAAWNEAAAFDLEYRRRPETALVKLNQSLSIDPLSEKTLTQLGDLYQAQQDWPRAVDAYRRAIDAVPDFPDAYVGLVDTYQATSQWPNAIDTAQHVAKIRIRLALNQAYYKPPYDYRNLWLCLTPRCALPFLGFYRDAVARSSPPQRDAAAAFGKLAFLYSQAGQLDQAIQATRIYLALAPNSPNAWEAHKNLALIYKQTGDLTQAIGELKTAASLATGDTQISLNNMAAQWQSP